MRNLHAFLYKRKQIGNKISFAGKGEVMARRTRAGRGTVGDSAGDEDAGRKATKKDGKDRGEEGKRVARHICQGAHMEGWGRRC